MEKYSFFAGLRAGLSLGRDILLSFIRKLILANGVYRAVDDGVEGYDVVTVSVPNSYTAAEEGKVVHNGALVAQTALSITNNGMYNTTAISSVSVNVSGGAAASAYFKLGASNVIVEIPETAIIAPMRSYTADYIVPCDSSGNDVKLDLSQPFEIGCRFKLLNAPGSDRNIWGSSDSYYRCPSIVMHSNRVTYSVSTSGNRWEYEYGLLTPSGWTAPLDTAMFARITWDGTSFAFYFDDGTNVYTAALVNVAPYYNAAYKFEFGGQNKSQYSLAAIGASVLLEGTYLQQGNTVIWGRKL